MRRLNLLLLAVCLAACSDDATEPSLGLAYGPLEHQRFDLHPARAGEEPRPVVVYFHEGGFHSGVRTIRTDRGLFKALLDDGITVVSASYGLAPEHVFPEPLRDAARAVQYVRHHANELGVDPGRIVVMGKSAGSVLAGCLAYGPDLAQPDAADPVLRESTLPAAYINWAGPVSFLSFVKTVTGTYFGEETLYSVSESKLHDASPLVLLTRGDRPPTPTFSWYVGKKQPLPTNEPHNPKFGEELHRKLRSLGDHISVNGYHPDSEVDPPDDEVAGWLWMVFGSRD